MDLLRSYESINELKNFLKDNNFSMSKRFGQNFLISPGSREKILSLLDLQKNRRVWEIGPGLGALTHKMVDQVISLTVFEIDHGFIRYLSEAFKERGEIELVEGDVVKTWKLWAAEHPRPDVIVGNLPYSSASAIIAGFIEHNYIPPKMVFTVQKEMGERISACPGTKNYSSFSMLCQFRCNVIDRGSLKPGSFYPSPEVISKIVELNPHKKYPETDSRLFFLFISDLFLSRRKKILNNIIRGKLSGEFSKDSLIAALEFAHINPDVRGETVDLDRAVQAVKYLQSIH